MKSEDPLESWLGGEDREGAWSGEGRSAEISTRLDELERLLDNPPAPPRKPDFYTAGIGAYSYMPPIPLLPNDLPRAQALYRRLATSKGSGKNRTQEGLLHLIGSNAEPSALPFWLEMVELAPPRDQFAGRRKTYALAAIAFIAIKHDLPAAYDALISLTRHRDPAIRPQAVLYLGDAYLDAERPIPDPVAAHLYDVATTDAGFLPRYDARRVLRATGREVPLDNPDGTYTFKVYPTWVRGVSRTMELRSYHTLGDLHLTIQRAFQWDDDHLYSFYLNGVVHDPRYEVPHPALLDGDGGFPFIALPIELAGDLETADDDVKQLLVSLGVLPRSAAPGGAEADGDAEEADKEPLMSVNAVIGELGLVPGHAFLYLFDFGDDNVFWVTVEGVKDKAGRGAYPRVVDKQGKAPPQYEYWEEEEE
ncbi:MAG TPA: hypothetical protein VND68_05360 [Chloroflexia bacterium]|nr:hypothetical protein [Chloroflexia bacterium]